MGFNFPSSPIEGAVYLTPNGKRYTFTNGVWALATAPMPALAMTISDTPPSNPINGQLWWESDTGREFVWYVDADSAQWVQVQGPTKPPFGSSGRITLSGAATKDTPVGVGANQIDIAISGMSLSVTGNMYLQLLHSGGLQNTGYSGSYGFFQNAAASYGKSLSDVAFASSYFPLTEGSGAATVIIANITMRRISTSDIWVVDGRISLGGSNVVFVMGNVAVANPLTQIRLGGTAGGTIDAGVAEVRWSE